MIICSEILKTGVNIVLRWAPSLAGSLSPSFFLKKPTRSLTWLHCKGNYKCGAMECLCCPHVLGGNTFRSEVNGKEYILDSVHNCNTSYVIYLITCSFCHIQYVGRTSKRLQDRFYEHVSSIDKKKSTNVGKHFNQHHGGDRSSLGVQVIDKIRPSNTWGDAFRLLCRREVYWIFTNTYSHGYEFWMGR